MSDYSQVSKDLTRQISTVDKRNQGIYFTPPSTVKSLTDYVFKLKNGHFENVLEPSCGSGEFLKYIDGSHKFTSMVGVELNTVIFTELQKDQFTNNITIVNQDFLNFKSGVKYDLIIGNPPYFVTKKSTVDVKYHQFFDGRPNIYILFVAKCLELLNPGGVLAFVLPHNFTNCLYYDKLRKHITDNFKIHKVEDVSNDKYIDTTQPTITIVIENKKGANNRFMFKDAILPTKTVKLLKQMGQDYESTTLHELGMTVNVGTVVWNQVKDKLTNDESKTRLIYNSDISPDHQLVCKRYKNPDKKNFIDVEGIQGKLLVINRGYGKGSYMFNYCLIDEDDKNYLIENHLICVNGNPKHYPAIIKSFENPMTNIFIQNYFGNNALNTQELQYVIPIFI